ncbi:hypothetical protein [Rubripirellula lacrimiformis]|uniref:hypothetical protein n=1 Tax=Rubripirellula lacrimiformis TaxID=1930273 RepID=UPI00119F65CC|nr:hypothetical protein [Rubripirellula lacrimiformis]
MNWVGDNVDLIDKGLPGDAAVDLRHFIDDRNAVLENIARIRRIDPGIADAAEVIVSQHLARGSIGIRLLRRRNMFNCLKGPFRFDAADGEPEAIKGDFWNTEKLVGKGQCRRDERELLQRASVIDGKPFLYPEQLSPPMR